MNTLEDRLRDAYRAAAETVLPGTTRSLADQAAHPARPAGQAELPRKRLAVPLSAAAAVAVIAVTAAVAVPGVLSRHHSGRAASSGVPAQAFPGGRVPAGPPPRYFVSMASLSRLDVISSATGRVVGHLAQPAPGRFFQGVAVLGNDRTFVAETSAASQPASASGCTTWLYQFRLTSGGQPTALTPLSVPEVAGYPQPESLAGSADGSTVAYQTANCGRQPGRKAIGQVGVIRVRAATVTKWTYRAPASPASLSLSASGSLLGMGSLPSGLRGVSYGSYSAWVLPTGSAPGPLGKRYHHVVDLPVAGGPVVLSPTGKVMVIGTARHVSGSGWRVTMSDYQTATGKLIQVVDVLPGYKLHDDFGAAADISGRYLLMYNQGDLLLVVDQATGRVSMIPGLHQPHDIAW